LKRPLIGILVSSRRKREQVLEQYERFHNQKVRLYAFSPADIHWKEKRIAGLYLNGSVCKSKWFPFPEAVYNRCYNREMTKTIKRLKKRVGNKVFNQLNFFNKWRMYKIIARSAYNTYLPVTLPYNQENLKALLRKHNLIYIKPIYGNKGEKVYRIERLENGEIHTSLHSLSPIHTWREDEDIISRIEQLIGQDKSIVQQGIRSSQINQQLFDIRVLVQKDITRKWTVSSIVCRVANKQYYNTSIFSDIYSFSAFSSRFLPSGHKLQDELNTVSVKVARLVEKNIGLMGELSVDFILDEQQKLWIIELNGMPQKSIYADLQNAYHEQLAYRRPIEYAYYLSRAQRK